MKQSADQRLAEAKKIKPKDVNFIAMSTPAKIRIVPSPVVLKVSPVGGAKKAGDKFEITVDIERKYGFDDAVVVTFTAPKGAAGISAKKLTIAKGQSQGKLEVTLAKNAKAGDHMADVKGTLKFNNISVSSSAEVALKVEAAPK
jgi:hypothetical protein